MKIKADYANTPQWKEVTIKSTLPSELKCLDELAHNMWWAWNYEARNMWKSLDSDLYEEVGHNPVMLLDRLSYERKEAIVKDKAIMESVKQVYKKFREYMDVKPDATRPSVAYFCMEYGINQVVKIYSGGLGMLAGDYMKEASDSNVNMCGVGFLYRYGYFKQTLSMDGQQIAKYDAQNFNSLPVERVLDENGQPMVVDVPYMNYQVHAYVWVMNVGRIKLYLLDTDNDLNSEFDRPITHALYGGDNENRLKQEILLGIGGILTLKKLGIKKDIYHCNEGHAALCNLQRLIDYIKEGLSFNEALELVRASSLYTVHTPVPAGHDYFDESLFGKYMGGYPQMLGITWDEFIGMGRNNPEDHSERFCMSVFACNTCQEVNGVSKLHGWVSQRMFAPIWKGYCPEESHVGYVTNGVHFPTWCATNMRRLYAKYFPEGFSLPSYNIPAWQKAHEIPDEELWAERLILKKKLINQIKKRVSDPGQFRFDSPAQLIRIQEMLKPDILTIGFARRFATYKRAHLLFTNLDRLDAIVNNPERPVQFIFAGKAHPNDKPGQDLIKRIVEVAAMPRFVGRIIFLQNYDMELARRMVQGVDIWLNTPTRPLEASGTSGEKAVMNGTMHFSVLDGWWVEGYHEGGGWKLPMERTFEDQNFQNELDAELIYNTIENEIIPKYYNRGTDNIPHEWLNSVKICIADIASNFTTNRMLADYQERFYDKLFARNTKMRAENFQMAREIAAWKRKVSNAWDKVRIVSVQRFDMGKEAIMIGHSYNIEAVIDVDTLRSEDIGVEVIMASQIDNNNVHIIAKRELKVERQEGSLVFYKLSLTPDTTGSFDIAIRVFPKNEKLPHRMDFALVKWA